ncbi:MAG: MoaD/ThiS family protein [Candidatus Aminicenantia bacterium]
MIKINFSSAFINIKGKRNLVLKNFRGNIDSLLAYLTKKYPDLSEEILTPQGNLEYHVLIVVNNQPISSLQGKKTEIKNGDIVNFYLLLAGG